MKFGKNLTRNQVPEWSSHYLDYKQLKKIIKQVNCQRLSRASSSTSLNNAHPEELKKPRPPPTEAEIAPFFYTLDRSIEIVDEFFNAKYSEYERRLNHVVERYPPKSSLPRDFDREELEDLIAILLEIRGQLKTLQWYAEVNKRGFVKILKKFDKKIETSVQQQYLAAKVFVLPFANFAAIDEKLAVVNKYLSQLSPYAEANVTRAEFASSTDDLVEGRELQRVKSNNSSGSHLAANIAEMRAATEKDDVHTLEALLDAEAVSQKSLLSVLSKAISSRANNCIPVIVARTSSLEDSSELNGRNIIHKLVVNQGRALLEDPESSIKPERAKRHFIEPAERPRPAPKLDRGMDADSGSRVEDAAETLKLLLQCLKPEERVSLISPDTHNRTPLHHAAYYGLRTIAQVILVYLAEWDLIRYPNLDGDEWKDGEGETPIHLAISNNHPKTARVLLEKSERPDPTSPLLSVAAMLGSRELLEVLLDFGLDVNRIDENSNETALFIAAKMNHVEAVRFLLERGADTEIDESTYGWTPLFVAAVDGLSDIVEALIEGKADINRTDDSGWTAMEHACLRGHIVLADKLKPARPMLLQEALSSNVSLPGHLGSGSGDSARSMSPESDSEHPSRIVRPVAKVKSGREIPAAFGGVLTRRSPIPKHNDPIKTFGHRYLRDNKAMVLVTLGSTDRRETDGVLKLDRVPYSKAHSTQLNTALSLVVSATNCLDEPSIVDLPLSESQATEPISFYIDVDKLDDVRLYFDIVPTYSGNRKKIIGRAVAMLKNIYTSIGKQMRSLHRTLTVPIVESETLDVLGSISFGFMVVTPFEHPNMGIEKSSTYWKSLITTRVIGHRGLGKNSTSRKSLQLGENTIESFIQAANLGASYVEFDVQLTKDYIPVLYHDFLVGETGIDIPMHSLTLEQFINISRLTPPHVGPGSDFKKKQIPQSQSPNSGDDDEGDWQKGSYFIRPNGRFRPRPRSQSVYEIDTRDEYAVMEERMRYTRDFKVKGFKGNYRGHSIQSPFTTLEEAFRTIPEHVGFNIECKYPMLDESENEDMENLAIELNMWVDTVLKCVYDNAKSRDIIFSSFNPDVCILISLKQPSIPVLFLTEAGTEEMSDVRATSLQEAIRFARRWDLLGIVSAAKPLIQCPRLVNVIKESGLVCVTYGADNNDPENARLQMKHGVDAVIVDSVLAVRKGLNTEDAPPSL
ncbi:glycerophosphocholine phosphodiesterase Gde1p [Trichomonascus vanleenenianus]|uniref:glycerophosphocholine phosphodiesterase n=1 Tax=Trichomonascus vanleenenianus TaxID=2268995 RepID=UPI003ECA2A56